MLERYKTVYRGKEGEIIEKKSRFIATVRLVETEEEALAFIEEMKKKYWNATHNCFAYVIGERRECVRCSDDGEPSGTAGAPMLNILQKNGYVNVLIVVTRYFGGILLGTGGLVRAYSDSLTLAIEKSIKIEKRLGSQLEVIVDYSELDNFKYYCRNNKINIIESTFEEKIICKIEMENDKKEKLIEDFNTKKVKIIEYRELCRKYITKCI